MNMGTKYTSEIKLKENMKPIVRITNNDHHTLINMKREKFEVIKNNMVISEIKTKGERGFVITIRNDGKDRDYRMGQLSFLSEKDLILIRDSIDRILNM